MKRDWIEDRLGQLGIEVRYRSRREMESYITYLREEIAATEEFLSAPKQTEESDSSIAD